MATRMAELLPTSERVDPAKVAERAWLAASCRPAPSRDPQAQEVAATLALAVNVARYDRDLGRLLAAEEVDRLPDLMLHSLWFNSYQMAVFRALVALDPGAMTALIANLPESARRPPPKAQAWNAASIETQIRVDAAEVLGLPPQARPGDLNGYGTYWRFERTDD